MYRFTHGNNKEQIEMLLKILEKTKDFPETSKVLNRKDFIIMMHAAIACSDKHDSKDPLLLHCTLVREMTRLILND